jgi:hypothetical protein
MATVPVKSIDNNENVITKVVFSFFSRASHVAVTEVAFAKKSVPNIMIGELDGV